MYSRRSFKFHVKAGLLSFCDPKFKPPSEKRKGGGNGRKQGLILVIDDERMIRRVHSSFAERMGYAAMTAEDGEKGVELYRENKDAVAVVVCDFVMPGMNGMEVLKRLREIDPNVRVIIASGFTKGMKPEELLEAGAKKFLLKPYGIKEFREAVEEVL